jgi:hypothetical protein
MLLFHPFYNCKLRKKEELLTGTSPTLPSNDKVKIVKTAVLMHFKPKIEKGKSGYPSSSLLLPHLRPTNSSCCSYVDDDLNRQARVNFCNMVNKCRLRIRAAAVSCERLATWSKLLTILDLRGTLNQHICV